MIEHLYIHVPFCDGKCHYCGFYSVMAQPGTIGMYVGMPAREYKLRARKWAALREIRPRTLYFGGGTPSMLGSDGFKALVDALAQALPLEHVEEWTVEVNPNSADPALLKTLAAYGANRISIGAQIFNDSILRDIGRRHTAAQTVKAVKNAQDAGFANTGIDLIAGLPGVSEALWEETLAQALELDLSHISVYSLILEANTLFAAKVEEGLALPDDHAQLAALAHGETVLTGAGFKRYEISNYAQSGRECQHNLAVWRGLDYLGLGPAAASRIGRRRWFNAEDLQAYGEALQQEVAPPGERETLSAHDDAIERIIFALRLHEGVDPAAAAARFPALRDGPEAPRWEATLASLAQHGLTERDGTRWRLTARGREVCDSILQQLV